MPRCVFVASAALLGCCSRNSYKLVNFISDCDRSCNGCDGDGPDNCFACAKGYFLNDNMCQGEPFCNVFSENCYFIL